MRIYVYEKIDPKYKNLGSGLSTISTITGSLLASYSAWFFTQESFSAHSWRYTFLIGSCASLTVCILRQFVEKNDDIKKEQNYAIYKEMSLLDIIRQNLQLFLLCTIIAGTIGASYGFNFTFFVNHNAVVLNNISLSDMQFYRSIGIALYIVFAIIGGWLADVFSSRICASSAIVAIILLNILNCYLIEQGLLYISLYLLISALLPIATIPALTLLNSAIPKVIRYRIFSMCHSCGAVLISGPSLILATKFYQFSKISWIPIVYFSFIMLLMLVAMNWLFLRQKKSSTQQ